MAASRLNLANLITAARIGACPFIFFLALAPGVGARFWAYGIFTVAAVSDLWDGYLARKHGIITDLGKLLDPLADKLLLISTFIPFYIISHRGDPAGLLPWWGELPLWVLVVIFGREMAVTLLRSYAVRQGEVISAGTAGKYKAFVQNLFSGGVLLWYPLRDVAAEGGWSGVLWMGWSFFHRSWIGIMLGAALILTVYSMGVYFWTYRRLLGVEGEGG